MAISVILLGGINLTPKYLVPLSWFVWIISFLKFCFLLPDLIHGGRAPSQGSRRVEILKKD